MDKERVERNSRLNLSFARSYHIRRRFFFIDFYDWGGNRLRGILSADIFIIFEEERVTLTVNT